MARNLHVPRRVLVTGGAGFIGSHLTDLLLARGDSVTVVDNLSTGRRSNLPRAHDNLRFIYSSLDLALVTTLAKERFDEIYHLAAAVGVQLIVKDPIGSIETNVGQTSFLLRYALRHGPGGKPARTLIASSSEVYGKGVRSPFRESDDVLYGPTTISRWSYACSKAIDEYLSLAYHAQHALPVTIARFFNTVGPRQVGDYGMVVPRFVQAALAGKHLEVHGDGTQSRCFCDVRDVAAVLPRLIANPACHGEIFNVGSDRPILIGELAKQVIKTLASPSRITHIPYEKAYSANFEDLRQRRPDLTKIREAVGFHPAIPLERTITDVAASLSAKKPAKKTSKAPKRA
jgi:UDP-glucose 4-epimerase